MKELNCRIFHFLWTQQMNKTGRCCSSLMDKIINNSASNKLNFHSAAALAASAALVLAAVSSSVLCNKAEDVLVALSCFALRSLAACPRDCKAFLAFTSCSVLTSNAMEISKPTTLPFFQIICPLLLYSNGKGLHIQCG